MSVVLLPCGNWFVSGSSRGVLTEIGENGMNALQREDDSEASQAQAANNHLWGALIPTSPSLKRVDFWQGQSTYKIGRHHSCDIQLSSPKISACRRPRWRARR